MVRILAHRVTELDRAWLLGVSRRRVPAWADWLLRGVTHAGGARATIGAPLVLLAIPGTRTAGLVALLANALSHLAVQLLKRTVVRPRPHLAGALPALAHVPDAFSFPSGHTAAATAVSLPVVLAWPATAPLLLPLVTLVAASRVYLRVHYVTDVVVGMLLGVLGVLAAGILVG